MKHVRVVATIVLLSACASYKPPAPQPARPEIAVRASVDRTWDAVLDRLSALNIGIVTVERSSGLIVTAPHPITGTLKERLKVADCGWYTTIPYGPTRVSLNIRVAGDSATARLRINPKFEDGETRGGPLPCLSHGVWEGPFEESVRLKAEGQRP